MKLSDLLSLVGNEPVFESNTLLAGDVDPAGIRQQLSRWRDRGAIIQLRRGVYTLAEPYRRVEAHPFVLANAICGPSYVSLQSALRYHDLIPENVPTTTSITTRRASSYATDLGHHIYRHLSPKYFWGYESVEVRTGQHAWVATASKALLDLVHLVAGGDQEDYLRSLRLQNLETFDFKALNAAAHRWGTPKALRAADAIRSLSNDEEYISL